MSARWALKAILVCCAAACEKRVVVGHEPASEMVGSGGAHSAETTTAGTSESSSAANETTGPSSAGGAQGLTLPEKGSLLWSAGFEAGDVGEWLQNDQGEAYVANDARYNVGDRHVHSGGLALEATLVSIGDQLPQAMMLRSFEMVEGYYSAHFCVPQDYDTNFLVIMKFRGDEPFQGSSTDDRFDIDLSRDADDQNLYLQLDEHGGEATLSSIPVPIDTWFKVEAFYRSTPDADGRLVVWQDGVLVFDTGPRPTAASSHVVFGTGIAAWRVNPVPASVFIDTVEVFGVE